MLMKEKNIKQTELVHMAEEKGIKLGHVNAIHLIELITKELKI